MAEIGDSLRDARTRRGIELGEAAQVTKIRVTYLRAMEEDQWELLPDRAYAPGFLRTYATFLGLDGAALVEEYSRRHERVEEGYPEHEPLLLKAPGRRKPSFAFAGIPRQRGTGRPSSAMPPVVKGTLRAMPHGRCVRPELLTRKSAAPRHRAGAPLAS